MEKIVLRTVAFVKLPSLGRALAWHSVDYDPLLGLGDVGPSLTHTRFISLQESLCALAVMRVRAALATLAMARAAAAHIKGKQKSPDVAALEITDAYHLEKMPSQDVPSEWLGIVDDTTVENLHEHIRAWAYRATA